MGLLRAESERQQTNRIHWLRNLSRSLEHELRNQVFIVQSNLEHLQQVVVTEQRPFVHRASKSVVKLIDLCDAVGEANTLESALHLERLHPVNFSRMVIERVLERSRDLDTVNPLDLDIDPDLWVSGSEQRLLEVFDHMLSSALENSSDDETVRIEVKSIAGSVYFTVHNRADQSAAKNDLFPVMGSSSSVFNVGMGLYVAHKILEHHGGTIEARTQFGQAVMLVTLPQTEAPDTFSEENELVCDEQDGPRSGVFDLDREKPEDPER